MTRDFLKMRLSFGQVAWAICYGRKPDRYTLDRLRYFRQLGIPFAPEEAQGSGNRMTYTFDHLFECGLAVECVRAGTKPSDVAKGITANRKVIRRLGRDGLDALNDEVLEDLNLDLGTWPYLTLDHEVYVLIYDRYAPKPWSVAEIHTHRNDDDSLYSEMMYEVPEGSFRRLLPLYRLVASLVLRAAIAPETKPGRQ